MSASVPLSLKEPLHNIQTEPEPFHEGANLARLECLRVDESCGTRRNFLSEDISIRKHTKGNKSVRLALLNAAKHSTNPCREKPVCPDRSQYNARKKKRIFSRLQNELPTISASDDQNFNLKQNIPSLNSSMLLKDVVRKAKWRNFQRKYRFSKHFFQHSS